MGPRGHIWCVDLTAYSWADILPFCPFPYWKDDIHNCHLQVVSKPCQNEMWYCILCIFSTCEEWGKSRRSHCLSWSRWLSASELGYLGITWLLWLEGFRSCRCKPVGWSGWSYLKCRMIVEGFSTRMWWWGWFDILYHIGRLAGQIWQLGHPSWGWSC